ncbi:hypothetical protein GCM10009789_27530 [Kribbella sancticallisti]|uniref:Uncharacterized protein n=1 Tax=Kribbella sancticallisti TaxID=460087 RepID=A0ABN2D942_9ACTN
MTVNVSPGRIVSGLTTTALDGSAAVATCGAATRLAPTIAVIIAALTSFPACMTKPPIPVGNLFPHRLRR